MAQYGVADSVELAILTKALDDYCAAHQIVGDSGRERIARKVMSLFRRGVITPEQLSAELERQRSDPGPRPNTDPVVPR